MEEVRNGQLGIVDEKIIEDTLEKLCVADIVQNYCASCISGNGCCATSPGSSSMFDEQALFDAVNQLPNGLNSFPEEIHLTTETVHTSTTEYTSHSSSKSSTYLMEESFADSNSKGGGVTSDGTQTSMFFKEKDSVSESSHSRAFTKKEANEEETTLDEEVDVSYNCETEQRPLRRRVTIDLSKEGNLSDIEIIRRLLSSSESLASDEPLEVILEIVGEEDASDMSDEDQPLKTFQSLRKKLRSSSFFTSSPKIMLADPRNAEIKTLPPKPESKKSFTWRSDFSPDIYDSNIPKMGKETTSPSYQKANSLINEIESCFMETANIVEKTLGAANNFNKSHTGTEEHNKSLRATRNRNKSHHEIGKHEFPEEYIDENVLKNGTDNKGMSKTVQEAMSIFDSIMSDANDRSPDLKEDKTIREHWSLNEGPYVNEISLSRLQQTNSEEQKCQENICQPISYNNQYYQSDTCQSNNTYLDNESYQENYFQSNYEQKASEFDDYLLSLNNNLLETERNNYQLRGEENQFLKCSSINEAESSFNNKDKSFFAEGNDYLLPKKYSMSVGNGREHFQPFNFCSEEQEKNYVYNADDAIFGERKTEYNPCNNMPSFWKNWQAGFERDVDELFRECYELSATEPNTSLSSCLKNLENLSGQLREAKENILQELIDEDNFDNLHDTDHCGGHISIENKKKLAMINELIEKKLKSKLSLEKFHVAPPMIGLEGKTHKVIAEVTPKSNILENGSPPSKENVDIKSFLMDNENIDIKRSFHNNIIENVISLDNTDMQDSAFETNSEISMATNTNSFGSISQTESTSYRKMDGTFSKNSSGSYSTDEGISSILSHEETLALYEDNQELQQSLLSILHSLNDIHDNFLRRRQKEVDLSQQSSQALHDNIKACITEKRYELMDQLVYPNSKYNHINYNQNNDLFSQDFLKSEAMSEDFEAIDKIIRVSDELKNLWLFGTDDLNTKRRKPSRSLSLNRFYRPNEYSRKYSNPNSADDLSEADDDNMALNNEKSCSMPNLNSDVNFIENVSVFESENSNQIIQPNDFFVDNFRRQMKYENAKCYEVTLNFLKRIMEACKLLDGDDDNSQPMRDTMLKSLSEFTSSKGQFQSHPGQHHQNKSMAALNLVAESRDYLMWCPDSEFDKSVSDLDMRGLVHLVHTLQDAMAVEQQTFESLSKQLEGATDPLLQQRMSAALCTSQTRLARLCSRNMRCFTQQALKSRPRSGEPPTNLDSRSSSPRDSGFAVSSSGSDFESDLRGSSMSSVSPPGFSYGGASFKNSMAFFQKAANLVAANPKSSQKGGHIHREAKRSYRRNSKQQPASTRQNKDQNSNHYRTDLNEDTETYENVLFINGRPQYQDDPPKRSHSYDGYLDSRKSGGENRVSLDYDYPKSRESRESRLSSCPGAASTTIHITSGHSSRSHSSPNNREFESSGSRTRVQILNESAVDLKPPSRPVRLKDSIHSKSLSDVTTCITLPRRKPVLNFSSVADCASDRVNSEGDFEDSYRGSVQELYNTSENKNYVKNSQIKRSHSFKEGLDYSYDGYCGKGSNLCRTQSCCDGLAGDIVLERKGSKLSRAPSVEEILESVKSLRAKRSAMVKSSPDLLQQSPQEKSSSRHKHSSKKSSKISTSSLVGVHFNGSVGTTTSSKSEKYDSDPHYYENIRDADLSNQYENLPAKKVEVIYDCPKSNQKVENRRLADKEIDSSTDHYENISFDLPLYENMTESEPTYMNVSGKVTKRKSKSADQSNLYANVQEASREKSKGNKNNRANDNGRIDSMHGNDDQTYDVPKASTHIYDTPPKQTRQVCSQSSFNDEGTYDTPKNNRSILPQSTQMLLKVKKDQMKKIEDIFADCEQDSLSGVISNENSPDIPPPDYGTEEEIIREAPRGKSSSSPSDYIDEGLGESDSRSYYADDQGLEVILEEPEDDYSSTHSSEEDLRRRLDLQLRLKGERRSLDGSEGIGSAEGDSHSSGSDIGVEDDCASSGIHSEDTSLGHPHIDTSKDFEHVARTQESSTHQKKEEDQIPQQDRCVEVYPETLRQRQRNMAPSPSKVDIKNWDTNSGGSDDDSKGGKKFLPSVKALRSQFESGKSSNRDVSPSPPPSISPQIRDNVNNLGRTSSNSSTSSLVMSSLEASSGFSSLTSSQATSELLSRSTEDEPVEPIFNQFHSVDENLVESMGQPPSTIGWNPQPLLKKLYYIPEAPKMHNQGTNYVNIDGYLEKLPSGRKKATFWNAWKRRYFVAKDGILYYYQNNQTEKANMKLALMGGKVEIMDQNMVNIDDGDKNQRSASMLGIDDGKGHYVVVRCPTRQEAERWKKALDTHIVEDFNSQYIQPWPRPTNPTLLRDTLVIDIGSCSVRAGVLASQPTLPQLFFPAVVATNRETRNQIWGAEALLPHNRTNSTIAFPIRPSHKISKFSVDLNSISSLLQKTFKDLKVDPKNYNIQLSVPRVLNPLTQAELLKILFDKFGVKAVNLTHQSILALYAYNATSGIVVDIGERIDVVPVTDGYIVDGGVSRIPYGGFRILDHIRQFLFQRNLSLVNEVDSYVIRQTLETVCYSAQHYNTEKQRCALNTDNFEKTVPLADFFPDTPQYEAFRNISLDFGRFQATEGLFNPDAWGLDHPGLQKLVHKAIQECSMDIRKEMSRSIFLSGGLSQLPGISERLTVELDNLTPPAIRPKVHSSPYRYHAAYLGACVLAESPAFIQSKITKEEWQKQGNSALRKWAL